MPNQLSVLVEQRIVAFSLGHPGLGPRRIASRLARPSGAACGSAPTASTRRWPPRPQHARQAAGAGRRATARRTSRRASPSPSRTSTRPGRASWSASTASSSAGCTAPRPGLADHRDRHLQQLRLGRTRHHRARRPERRAHLPARAPRRRRARRGRVGGSNACCPTTAPSSAAAVRRTHAALGARHSRIRAGRPQTNGHVERLQRTILEECWRPAFARFLQVRFGGLRRELAPTSTTTTTTAPTPDASQPGDARPNSSTVRGRWSRDEPTLSAHLGVCSA